MKNRGATATKTIIYLYIGIGKEDGGWSVQCVPGSVEDPVHFLLDPAPVLEFGIRIQLEF